MELGLHYRLALGFGLKKPLDELAPPTYVPPAIIADLSQAPVVQVPVVPIAVSSPVLPSPPAPSASQLLADQLKVVAPGKGGRPRTVMPEGMIYELWKNLSKNQKAKEIENEKQRKLKAEHDAQLLSGGSLPSAPAARFIDPLCKRVLIEFCCESDSKLSAQAHKLGWAVERLSLDRVDLVTGDGLSFATLLIRDYIDQGFYVHLWGSIPCTAWAKWNEYNYSKGSRKTKAKIDAKRVVCLSLVANFVTLGRLVVASGGDVSYEWPSLIKGWELDCVKDMVSEFSMDSVNVHGCMLGVKHSKNGKPIKKPWTIKSSNSLLLLFLSPFKCNHTPHEHEVCAGAQTVFTGFYPFEFCDVVLNGLRSCPDGVAAGCPGFDDDDCSSQLSLSLIHI